MGNTLIMRAFGFSWIWEPCRFPLLIKY